MEQVDNICLLVLRLLLTLLYVYIFMYVCMLHVCVAITVVAPLCWMNHRGSSSAQYLHCTAEHFSAFSASGIVESLRPSSALRHFDVPDCVISESKFKNKLNVPISMEKIQVQDEDYISLLCF